MTKHLKNLKEGEIYRFYSAYKFNSPDDFTIDYDANLDSEIYNYGDLNISISAVVGMNGSGKSTIAEFLYLIINQISREKNINTTHKLKKAEIFADLFIKSDRFYKISVGQKTKIFVYDYDETGSKYLKVTDNKNAKKAFEDFDIEAFCYSIVVNYSLYALNSKIIGSWVNPLFHKNDSYQIPIVLNPKRNNGVINVNIEDELAKSRLLFNLLEPRLINFESKFAPPLVPGSIPKILMLQLNFKKLEEKRKKYKSIINKDKIERIIKGLNIIIREDVEFLEEAKEYIYLKIASIPYTYAKFKDYRQLHKWMDDGPPERLQEYLNKVLSETSHIAFKLRQAINYLVHGLYNTKNKNNILDLGKKISDVQNSNLNSDWLQTIYLIPPSFLKTNVLFEHGGNFDLLSSGEKQQILSINTIAYHLYNLKSVMAYEENYKYRSINIVFDEVELYFHPDLQRTYINNLISRIITLNLNEAKDINNINIIFITHSPFILSDIPKSNILMLKRDEKTKIALPLENDKETFAANVHDLLANDFFMENGFMGEFSKNKIDETIKFLNYVQINGEIANIKETDKSSVIKKRLLNAQLKLIIESRLNKDIEKIEKKTHSIELLFKPKEYYKSLIELIGEPVLKIKLNAMFHEVFPKKQEAPTNDDKFDLLKKLANELGIKIIN